MQIFRVGHLLEAHIRELLGRIAKKRTERFVNLQEAAFCRDQRHADGGIFHRVAKARFALGNELALFPGGVHHHRHHVSGQQDH